MPQAQFEWDPDKAAKNQRKHGVEFDEAATVFSDPMLIMLVDAEHSQDEERYITIGLSRQGRLLVIAHTERGAKRRIISARRATKKEAAFYAKAD